MANRSHITISSKYKNSEKCSQFKHIAPPYLIHEIFPKSSYHIQYILYKYLSLALAIHLYIYITTYIIYKHKPFLYITTEKYRPPTTTPTSQQQPSILKHSIVRFRFCCGVRHHHHHTNNNHYRQTHQQHPKIHSSPSQQKKLPDVPNNTRIVRFLKPIHIYYILSIYSSNSCRTNYDECYN